MLASKRAELGTCAHNTQAPNFSTDVLGVIVDEADELDLALIFGEVDNHLRMPVWAGAVQQRLHCRPAASLFAEASG